MIQVLESTDCALLVQHALHPAGAADVCRSKMATWASHVRFIFLFLTFCCDAKKTLFFIVGKKLIENLKNGSSDSLGGRRSENTAPEVWGGGGRGGEDLRFSI